MIEITAHIENLSYKPILGKPLESFNLNQIRVALEKPVFLLNYKDNTTYAISQWVSPKRTRSYPYVRVYDTLAFNGKRITLIPVIKDEGYDGDRDYIQWDTISLMSLLQTYVILVFYDTAQKSPRYSNKITKQRISEEYLLSKIDDLHSYKWDALHWNLSQSKDISTVTQLALDSYRKISQTLNVRLHEEKSIEKKIISLINDYEFFLHNSREMAQKAQHREICTEQPKELTDITKKAKITITNFLKGTYFFTVDEVEIEDNTIKLIEAKHTKHNHLPSREDIIDGLIKMTLYTNLVNVMVNNVNYTPCPCLKLTTSTGIIEERLNNKQHSLFDQLKQEANLNKFKLILG